MCDGINALKVNNKMKHKRNTARKNFRYGEYNI